MKQSNLFLYLIFGIVLLTACQSDNHDEDQELPLPENATLVIEPETVKLAVGQSCQLVAKLNGVPLDNNKVSWKSNSNMLSVDKGKVTAMFYDEFLSALLTVTAKIESGLYATCKISVYQEYDYKYRLILKDKGVADFSLNQPEQFLSAKAIERRNKRNIVIDQSDLPISKTYLEQIKKVGGSIVSQSKWLKTVCVKCKDESLIDEYKKLPFVDDVIMVWRGVSKTQEVKPSFAASSVNTKTSNYFSDDYGDAWKNIFLHQG